MIPHEFNGRTYYICEACGTNVGLRPVVNCSVCAGRRASAASLATSGAHVPAVGVGIAVALIDRIEELERKQ